MRMDAERIQLASIPKAQRAPAWWNWKSAAIAGILFFIVTGIIAVERVIGPEGTSDFRGFWEAAHEVSYRGDPYDADEDDNRSDVRRYLPFFSMFLSPLGRLPRPVAGAIWHCVAYASLIGSALLCAWWRQRGDRWALSTYIVSLAATTAYWMDHLVLLQVALVTMGLTLAGIYLTSRRRPLTGGALLGLAITLKLTPALFVPYLLLKRRWRAAIASVVTFVLLCVSTVGVFGVKGAWRLHWQWLVDYGATAGVGFYEAGESMRYKNASLPGVLARLLLAEPHIPPGTGLHLASLQPETVAAIAAAVQLAALGMMAYLCFARRSDEPLRLAEVGLVFGLTALFTPIAWTHHFVALIPACAALWRAGDRASRTWLAASVLAQFTLIDPTLRAAGGVLLADLLATVGTAHLLWRTRTAPPQANRQPEGRIHDDTTVPLVGAT